MANRDLELLVRLIADTNSINKGVTGINSKLGALQSGLGKLGIGLGIGAAAAVAMEFMDDAINKAVELEEAQSKLEAIFGDSTDEVEDWAAANAAAYRMSGREAVVYAGNLGALAKTQGIANDQLDEFTTGLLEAAGDLASFNNATIDDALNAIRSGLAGESEPLRRFGIDVRQARLEADALGAGLMDSSSAARVANSIFRQMSQQGSVGDSARTMDTAAGKASQLRVKLDDLQTKIGKGLLPAQVAWNEAMLASIDVMNQIVDSDAFQALVLGTITAATGGLNVLIAPLDAFNKEFQAIVDTTGLTMDEFVQLFEDMHGKLPTDTPLPQILDEVRAFANSPEFKRAAEQYKAATNTVIDQTDLLFETLGDARAAGTIDWSSILPQPGSVKLFDFDFGSPKEWIANINKELREANVELREFLNNPKARRSLEAGVQRMQKRLETLMGLSAQTAKLGTAGGNLMTVFGASILSKTNKAKADVGAAMEELGLSGTDDFIEGFKPTPAQWLSTMPDKWTIQDAFWRLGFAARTGFLQGFGKPAVPTGGGTSGGGSGGAPLSRSVSSEPAAGATINLSLSGTIVDPIGTGRAVVNAIRAYEAQEGALWRRGSGATRTRYG